MHFLNLLTNSSNVLNFQLSSAHSSSQVSPSDQIDNSAFRKVPTNDLNGISLKKQDQKGSQMTKIMEERQKLINQYLQLNIQLLEKEINQKEKAIESKDHLEKEETPKEEQRSKNVKIEVESNKKKIKKANNCGHPDKPHYAKGMCNNCYHRCGRDKKPWRCQHEKLYAAGLCQNCYINDYNRKKRIQLGQNEALKGSSEAMNSQEARLQDRQFENKTE